MVGALAVVPESEAPQVFRGGEGEFADGGDGAVTGQGPEHVRVPVGDVADGVVVDEDVQGGGDGDTHQAGAPGRCPDLLGDGAQDVLGGVDPAGPADREVVGVDVAGVLNGGGGVVLGVVLGVVDRFGLLADRLRRRLADRWRGLAYGLRHWDGAVGGLEFADCVDECAGEVGQEGLDVVVGAQARQEFVRALFEARGDGAATHCSAPCAKEER